MKKIIVAVVLLFLFNPLYPVYAQTSTSTSSTNLRDRLNSRVEQRKDITTLRKETFLERKENLKERVATHGATLKRRLDKFRDKTKATIIERVSNLFNTINDRLTDKMLDHLKRAGGFLDRLDTRVNNAAGEGLNTTEAKDAIADAREKIASTSAAVEAQALKDYTVDVSTEAKSKEEVRTTRQKLHADLKAVYALVKDAQKAVVEAIRTTASSLKGVRNGT